MSNRLSPIIRDLREMIPVQPLTAEESAYFAEEQARRLLEILGVAGPSVPVGLIGKLPGVDIEVTRDVRMGQANLAGYSEWQPHAGRWVIKINGRDSVTRQRWTLAHEFKHVLDHQIKHVIYRPRPPVVDPTSRPAEEAADYFAACLLLPRSWVEGAWIRGMHDVAQLAALFQVSPIAMSKRVGHLGLRRRFNIEDDGLSSKLGVVRYFRVTPAPQRTNVRDYNKGGKTCRPQHTSARCSSSVSTIAA
jgi:hypothetical protein